MITAVDLQTALSMSDTEYDSARGTLLISLAQKIIQPIAGNPIPDAADPIMLSAVMRAYLNPGGATNLGAGPYTAAFPAGGVYLTKAERGALARAIGRGNHFSIECLPAEYREAP
jgi:hypothetical protein